MSKYVHHFSFFLPPRDRSRRHRIATRRDLGAALDLVRGLIALGYLPGEAILNFPPDEPEKKDDDAEVKLGLPRREPPWPVDLSFVHARDVILTPTRPPLDDMKDKARKWVRRGNTDFEQFLFSIWRQYLEYCSRSEVRLVEDLYYSFESGFESHRKMLFRECEGASIKSLSDCTGPKLIPVSGEFPTRTVAFLLRLEALWKGGPGYIGAFGMDGTSTAVWAYRLGRDFAYLLERPGFTVVELTNMGIPPRPTNLRWASDWRAEVILEAEPFAPPQCAPERLSAQVA